MRQNMSACCVFTTDLLSLQQVLLIWGGSVHLKTLVKPEVA